MRFAQTIDGNRNGAHAHLGEVLSHFGRYERGVARHAPAEALLVGIAHDVEEVAVQKRLAACDAQLHARDVEVSFDLVDDVQPFVPRQVVGAYKPRCARAAAMEAPLVALQRELEEELAQFRRAVKRARVIGKLTEMVCFDIDKVHGYAGGGP